MSGATWLVSHGVWTHSQARVYVTAASLAILSIGLSLWKNYFSRLKLMVALLHHPGATENQVEDVITRVQFGGGVLPSTLTSKDVIPNPIIPHGGE